MSEMGIFRKWRAVQIDINGNNFNLHLQFGMKLFEKSNLNSGPIQFKYECDRANSLRIGTAKKIEKKSNKN